MNNKCAWYAHIYLLLSKVAAAAAADETKTHCDMALLIKVVFILWFSLQRSSKSNSLRKDSLNMCAPFNWRYEFLIKSMTDCCVICKRSDGLQLKLKLKASAPSKSKNKTKTPNIAVFFYHLRCECWNNSAANNVIELTISSEFDETATCIIPINAFLFAY